MTAAMVGSLWKSHTFLLVLCLFNYLLANKVIKKQTNDTLHSIVTNTFYKKRMTQKKKIEAANLDLDLARFITFIYSLSILISKVVRLKL